MTQMKRRCADHSGDCDQRALSDAVVIEGSSALICVICGQRIISFVQAAAQLKIVPH
jgi:hypothetical protein